MCVLNFTIISRLRTWCSIILVILRKRKLIFNKLSTFYLINIYLFLIIQMFFVTLMFKLKNILSIIN